MTKSADTIDLKRRLAFVGMDAEARATLRGLKDFIAVSIGPALDAFYAQVQATPETAKFFTDARHMARAKAAQAAHWQVIVGAEFSDAYASKSNAIGKAHARLGLEPQWYIGGYALVLEQLIHALVSSSEKNKKGGFLQTRGVAGGLEKSLSAIVKVALLDMELALSTYIDLLEKASHASELKRSECFDALTAQLECLARGDLKARIDCELAPEYQGIKDKFNATIEKLQNTMFGVEKAASSIDTAVQEIGQAADDLSRRTESQAASLEETTASVVDITTTVARTADGARQARQVVAAAKTDAEKGGEVVRKAVESMGDIEKSSKEITQIIGVIDEIAFQTNLLALNAGVEAARAGDAGRGFAVVASEVRALAQRSAGAAKQIKELISKSSSQVEQGVELVRETGGALDRIVSGVTKINTVVAEIAAGAEQQATGLREVSSAINQMDQVTQQNAAMVEEATAATRNLAQQTDQLVRLVGNFTASGLEVTNPLRDELKRVAPHAFPPHGGGEARVAASARLGTAPSSGPARAKPTAIAAGSRGHHGAAAVNEEGWEEF